MLMAAPVPSTGLVARSPSWKAAVRPLANVAAGATAAAAPVADALGEALALGAALPDADAEADADAGPTRFTSTVGSSVQSVVENCPGGPAGVDCDNNAGLGCCL
ncbi:MAG TPA: hypothetical protein VN714_12165, partial [Trebonia sp.]|nr:hypothetical protein [Trebonia sp.]